MSDWLDKQHPLGLDEFCDELQVDDETTEPDALARRPGNRAELKRLVESAFGLVVPDKPRCPHHHSPMDYLAASFFEQPDLLLWANRGGGKTMLAAVATILDAVFRAPAQILVLGGSFDQSDRLADYIRGFLHRRPELVDGRITKQRVRLVGGSEIRMLAQSQQAVRGQHVQKIRCDEVELFDEEVWRAVQFSTRSRSRGRHDDRGAIEVLSTLHRSGGIMQRLVQKAVAASPVARCASQGAAAPAGQAAPAAGYRLVHWCLWDVIERCEPWRKCDACPLAEDCRGVARSGEGFFHIDDAIAIKARSSRSAWETEMLCRGAKRDHLVFGEFDPARHVAAEDYRADWPVYRAIDFGYAAPLVCLWVQVSPGGRVHVIDEYVRRRLPLSQHAVEILRRDPAPAAMTYVDPAGRQRESTSGAACTELLSAAGIPCAWRGSTIAEGLELIRAALAPAVGPPRLVIHPRCTALVEAFNSYHYPPQRDGDEASQPGRAGRRTGRGENPVKDGPDHLIDALRYFFVNKMRPQTRTHRARY